MWNVCGGVLVRFLWDAIRLLLACLSPIRRCSSSAPAAEVGSHLLHHGQRVLLPRHGVKVQQACVVAATRGTRRDRD